MKSRALYSQTVPEKNMEKQKADKVITQYLNKIYGFAVKKSFSFDEAEDLCSEIIFAVYSSLLKSDEIYNLDGYIWRISEHTYAKYVATKKRHEGVSIDGLILPAPASLSASLMSSILPPEVPVILWNA